MILLLLLLLLLLLGRGRVDHVRCRPAGRDNAGVVLQRVNNVINGSSARRERGGRGRRFESSGRPL